MSLQDRKWFLQNSGLGNFKQKPENVHDTYKQIGVEKTVKVKLTIMMMAEMSSLTLSGLGFFKTH